MSESTHIEWTDATWNVVTGCTRVSPGCKYCYAEALTAGRLRSRPAYAGLTNEKGRWTREVRFHPERLDDPLRWRKPRRVFVCSMSDLFHPSVPDEFILRVWHVMADCPQHTFQVLTKRPERLLEWAHRFAIIPAPNIWLGTSVEDQRRADERIPHLLRVPAAVRFLSVEPMLGPVSLVDPPLLRYLPLYGLGWTIIGGESGRDARPMDLAWVRDLLAACRAAQVPVFVKQLGSDWAKRNHARHPKGGDPAEWPEDLRVREWANDDAT